MSVIGQSSNQVGMFAQINGYMNNAGYRAAASWTAFVRTNPAVTEALQVAPTTIKVTTVLGGLGDIAENMGLGHDTIEQAKAISEHYDFDGLDEVGEGIENLDESLGLDDPEDVSQELSQDELSTVIGGELVEKQAAEIK